MSQYDDLPEVDLSIHHDMSKGVVRSGLRRWATQPVWNNAMKGRKGNSAASRVDPKRADTGLKKF